MTIASTFRLEVCGIDYITADVTASPELVSGAYIEVNSMPQDVGSRARVMMDNLFKPGFRSSAPSVLLLGQWSRASASELENCLGQLLGDRCDVVIGVPAALSMRIIPVLSARHQCLVQVFNHPRELLLSRAIERIIYVVNPKMVWSRGFPFVKASDIVCLPSVKNLEPAVAWHKYLYSIVDKSE